MKKFLALLLTLTMLLTMCCVSALAAEEPVTITLWHRWGGANEQYLHEIIDNFMANNPDVKVDVNLKNVSYTELLQGMIVDAAAGNPLPDAFVSGYNVLDYIATELNPTTVQELAPSAEAEAELLGRFSEEMKGLASYRGESIGLPLAASNMVMYVNMDLFKEAGLTEADIPKTWEEVEKVCAIITEKTDAEGIVVPRVDSWADQALIYSAGGTVLSEDGTQVDLTNEGCVKAMTFWQSMYQNGYVPNIAHGDLETTFQAGDIAMDCTTIMTVTAMRTYCDFDLRIVEVPSFEGFKKQLPAGGAAMVSFTNPEDEAKRDAMWRFLDYLYSDEAMKIFGQTGYFCVTNMEVEMTPDQEPMYAQKPYAMQWVNWPGGSIGLEIEGLWVNARDAICAEGADVVSTLEALEEECNMMLDF